MCAIQYNMTMSGEKFHTSCKGGNGNENEGVMIHTRVDGFEFGGLGNEADR